MRISHNAEQVWWLNPAWLAGLAGILVSIAAYVTPEATYLAQWHTPKYFTGEFFAISVGMSLLFAFGAVCSMLLAKGAEPVDWKRDLPWEWITAAFWLCVVLSVAAYFIWLGVAIARGVTLDLALAVLKGQKNAFQQMKDVYLVTISGVTTLTQLGIPAVILGVMIGSVKGWKPVLPPIVLLFALSVIRALFNAERLAIIELAIPVLVISLRLNAFDSPGFQGRWKTILQFAPIFGGILLLGIFGVFEYFRSWSSHYSAGDQSFWQFVVLRLSGYYVTALNNGALMASRIDPVWAPFSVLHGLWRFPVLSGLMDAAYPGIKLDSVRLDPYMDMLDREANPEFNNSSALLPPIVDFGVAGAFLFWLCAGLLCGLLYRWYLDGKPTGLLFYPIFFTGITETTRIMYWGEGRAVATYIILIPLAWLCTLWVRRTRRAERRLTWLPSH